MRAIPFALSLALAPALGMSLRRPPAGAARPVVARRAASPAMAEYTVKLQKPLGMVLDEEERGVSVSSLVLDGNAMRCGEVLPGDALLRVFNTDVSAAGFDEVMEVLAGAPQELELTLAHPRDAEKMDITPNLAKALSPADAVLVDATVRAAVRDIRASAEARSQLGQLLRVEIVVGAGVRPGGRCLVRFFAIFATGSVASSYSCNVSATGVRDGEAVRIVALSCAKDEGWGRTIDLRREERVG